jgi:hypothetical protein
VAGLNDLLRVRKVVPHEEVDIRRFVALVEVHGVLLEQVDKDIDLDQLYVGDAGL